MAYYVYNGQVSSGIILNNDSMYVSSGGTADSTTVNSNGWLYVHGGTATGTVIEDGGFLGFAVGVGGFIQGTSAGSAFELDLTENHLSGYTIGTG